MEKRHGAELRTVGAFGVSGMMHGYLPFDRADNLLVPPYVALAAFLRERGRTRRRGIT